MMKYWLLSWLACVLILAGCADTPGALEVEDLNPSVGTTTTGSIAEISECGNLDYYNSLRGEQVYHYEYDTDRSARVAEIPEMCLSLIVADADIWEDESIADVLDAYKNAGVLRVDNTLQQHPLSQDVKDTLQEQHSGTELYVDDTVSALISVIDIMSGVDAQQSMIDRRSAHYPDDECTAAQTGSASDSYLVDTDGVVKVYRDTDDPSRVCPQGFAYGWEQRIIIPTNYPQSPYGFFAPQIDLLDRS